MTRQVFKSGQSFCMTLPKAMAKILGLKERMTVEVRYDPELRCLKIFNLTRMLESGKPIPQMTEKEKQYDLSLQG